MNADIEKLNLQAEKFSENLREVIGEVSKVIVGQDDLIRKTIITLMSNGHALLEGVPGLAKTLLISTLSECISSSFNRIQFTPDLLPADITGIKIYNHETQGFVTKKGPVFANLILADEINRAPPKVQSALLEAMQEREVTIYGESFKLKSPFFVLATQNPIESEGTYKLPEAEVDRFMFKLVVTYPSFDDSKEIIRRMTKRFIYVPKKVIGVSKILEIQSFVKNVYCDESIVNYVVTLVDATRNPKKYGIDINHFIDYGASPRALLSLTVGAKAVAVLFGRGYVTSDDVRFIAHDVLRHRIILSYEAEAEGIKADQIVDMILDKVEVP